MDKKILSAAVAGIIAGSMAFAANADVTVYGQIDVSIDAVDVDGRSDDINMNGNTNALGVKGSEDLGNGMKAIFQMEFQTDVTGDATDAGSVNTGRDQWVGLEGGFGKVRLGTASTTYKSSGAKVDPIYRTSLQGRDHGLQSRLHSQDGDGGQGRMTNGLFYSTPDFNGFTASAEYSFDDNCNGNSVPTCSPDDDAYGLGAQYKNGGLFASVAYITSDKGGDDDATQINASYNFGDFALFGQYEIDGGLISQADNDGAFDTVNNANDGADIWHLGGTFTMGNVMLYAAYGQGDDSSVAANTEYDVWTLAGTYGFSKRTMMYAGFNQTSCDAGLWRNNATNVCRNVSATGGEVDQFTFGMRHKF